MEHVRAEEGRKGGGEVEEGSIGGGGVTKVYPEALALTALPQLGGGRGCGCGRSN
jgi:hypothetical protein